MYVHEDHSRVPVILVIHAETCALMRGRQQASLLESLSMEQRQLSSRTSKGNAFSESQFKASEYGVAHTQRFDSEAVAITAVHEMTSSRFVKGNPSPQPAPASGATNFPNPLRADATTVAKQLQKVTK